jgi:hypothetical protein
MYQEPGKLWHASPLSKDCANLCDGGTRSAGAVDYDSAPPPVHRRAAENPRRLDGKPA